MTNAANPLPSDDLWSMTWGSFGARGPGAFVVRIAEDFVWPSDSYAIHAVLCDPEGNRVPNATRLTKRRLSGPIPLFPEAMYDVFSDNVEDKEPEWASIARVLKSGLSDIELVEALLPFVQRRDPNYFDLRTPERLQDYTVHLEHRDAAGNVMARGGSKNKENVPYDWHRIVLDHDSPCFGLYPTHCVYNRLQEVRRLLCERLPPLECLAFAILLETEPLPIEIHCTLGDGVQAKVDGATGRLEIGGEEFLNSDCPAETIIHELSHMIDYHTPGRIEAHKKFQRAVADFADAERRFRRTLGNPDNLTVEEMQALRSEIGAEMERANAIKEECSDDNKKELVETECRALFFVLERTRLLHSDREKIAQCEFLAISSMLTFLIQSFYVEVSSETRDMLAPLLKACFTRMREWLDLPENRDTKEIFENEPYKENTSHSFGDLLDYFLDILGN